MGGGDVVYSRNQEIHTIVEWLTPITSDATHYDTLSKRMPGTGEWFLSSTQFKDWLSGQRSILLLDGKRERYFAPLLSIAKFLLNSWLRKDYHCVSSDE
ncbi:hypothetical protein JR316_0013496 [Psilocybe cubensis]|uniref:Uncharacterized protein n=1 Tax=Psilocybe cubensis TaxID=181762 RepID=A0ACB8GFA5_PSICU|nr:uncharacterized protein JR316_0013496 [Psilocybe cubensis]KAH9474223.1 hypothetical protein JR316_0013496 [Psilocybe cubensis]